MRQAFAFAGVAGATEVSLPTFKTRFRINTVFANFTNTSGGDCYPRLEIFDGEGLAVAWFGSGHKIATGETAKITWAIGLIPQALATTDNFFAIPIAPDLWVEVGWTARVTDGVGLGPVVWNDLNLSFSANTKELLRALPPAEL